MSKNVSQMKRNWPLLIEIAETVKLILTTNSVGDIFIEN